MKRLENVREVLGTLKRRKPTQIYCPRCTSPKINLSSSFNMWLMPKNYLCNNCGYQSPVVLELEKEEEGN